MNFDSLSNQSKPDMVAEHVKDQESTYWSNFYEKNDFNRGSSFYEFINKLPELPETIIDIGCGQGRDSFAFAQSGKQVIGLDRSEVGVENANNKAIESSLDSTLSFATCDVSDVGQLSSIIDIARQKADGNDVVFYMRFFLHSIPEDTQESLMDIVASLAQPGDVFAAEFRTDKDIENTRVFGDSHYRRYQNAEDFSTKLQDTYGWSIVFETEDRGLSPYGEEDPTLYRVIATR